MILFTLADATCFIVEVLELLVYYRYLLFDRTDVDKFLVLSLIDLHKNPPFRFVPRRRYIRNKQKAIVVPLFGEITPSQVSTSC